MKPADANLVTVVPREHRWLKGIFAALAKVGLPVRDAVLADRTLRVALGSPRDAEITLRVRPASSGERGWKSTRRFIVGYDGAGDLSAEQEKFMLAFYGLLVQFENRMPGELEGYASILTRRKTPEETFLGLFPFVTLERSQVDESLPYAHKGEIVEVLVRVTSRCNQFCAFCSAPRHDDPSLEMLIGCFRAVSDMLPGAMVSLTGGEPTLRSTFLDEAKALLSFPSIGRVQIQTNALHFASRLDPGSIPQDGRLNFFVSLHALDPGVYDRCTGTQGQLPTALEGTQRILDAGHAVTVNTVITTENLDHLEDMVLRLPNVFSGENRPALHFSVLICPEYNPKAMDFLARYTDVVPVLEKAAQRAKELGMDVHSLLSSTHASMPPCLVSEQSRQNGRHAYQVASHETGYEDFSRPYVKSQKCVACEETGQCLGVPRAYAQKYGLSELKVLGGG